MAHQWDDMQSVCVVCKQTPKRALTIGVANWEVEILQSGLNDHPKGGE